MIIKKFDESFEGSNSFLIIDDDNNAILIDASENDMMLDFIKNNKINLQYIILTHEHIDHISGLNKLREEFSVKVIASEACNYSIKNSISNMARYFETFLYFKRNYYSYDDKDKEDVRNTRFINYTCKDADIIFKEKYGFKWNNHEIELTKIQGHSKGSIAILLDNSILFSGDSLLSEYEVITKFPGGSTKDYNNIALPYLKSLDMNIIVYPGHGESFMLKEKFKTEEK